MRVIHEPAKLLDVVCFKCGNGFKRALVLVDGVTGALAFDGVLDRIRNRVKLRIGELTKCLDRFCLLKFGKRGFAL